MQKVYSYRQSRGRRVIGNTSNSMRAGVRNAEKYVLACISLQNYLMQTNYAKFLLPGFVDCGDKNGTIKPGE